MPGFHHHEHEHPDAGDRRRRKRHDKLFDNLIVELASSLRFATPEMSSINLANNVVRDAWAIMAKINDAEDRGGVVLGTADGKDP